MAQDSSSIDERSPLLRDSSQTNGNVAGTNDPEQDVSGNVREDSNENGNKAIVEEPSTSRKIAIMGALWVGVYFAALGMSSLHLYNILHFGKDID